MGREIRRVPPNWEHPKNEEGDYISMYDEDYESAADKWVAECVLWSQGQHPDQLENKEKGRRMACRYYWEWAGGPPDEESHRPKFTEEPTWYQMYQNVSEGTPVSPPFETLEELRDWIVVNGDGWGRPVSREAADRFVQSGYAPSMAIGPEGMKVGLEANL